MGLLLLAPALVGRGRKPAGDGPPAGYGLGSCDSRTLSPSLPRPRGPFPVSGAPGRRTWSSGTEGIPRRLEATGRHSRRKETGPLIDRVTGRYEQFRQAAERARAGEWNAEEFEAFLLHLYDILTAKAVDCRAFIEESRYREEAPDEVDRGLRGLDLYEVGMHEMWLYLEDGDPGHLDSGLEMLWEGNEKINEAMRLNRDSREDLDLNFFL